MTLRGFFDQVYRPRRLLTGSEGTIVQYGVAIRHFARFLGRPALLADLTEKPIGDFLMSFSRGRQPGTVWSARKNLLSLAAYAHRKGLLAEVPDVAPVKRLHRAPQAYTVADIERLLAAARQATGDVAGVPAGLFWSALFLVAYDTGARSTPLWRLEWTDWRPPCLLFRAENAKTRQEQLIRVSPQTAAAIEAIRKPERKLIFACPWERRQRYNRLRWIFQAAGLPSGRRDLIQKIRRTTATVMFENGGDPTRQLGHASDSMTRAHYLDPSHAQQACDVLPRPRIEGEPSPSAEKPAPAHNARADELRRIAHELLALADREEGKAEPKPGTDAAA
jgi:integrase